MMKSGDFSLSHQIFGPRALAYRGFKISENGNLSPKDEKALPLILKSSLKNLLHSRIENSRKMYLLRKLGLFGSPANTFSRRKIEKADRARYYFHLESALPEGHLSRRIERAMEVYRAMVACLFSLYSGISEVVRSEWLPEMRRLCIFSTEWMCANAKVFIQSCREKVLANRPYVGPLQKYWSDQRSDEEYLQAGNALRALPAPFLSKEFKEEKEEEHLRRLTVPYVPNQELKIKFQDWLRDWVQFNIPKYGVAQLPISPSTSASMEFSRSEGGFDRSIYETLKTPLSDRFDKWFKTRVREYPTFKFEGVDTANMRASDYLIAASLTILEPMMKHARKCAGGCVKWDKHPPLCPLFVGERGYKVRIPQMTISAVGVIARILRSCIEGYLRNDPRIRPSLEGKAEFPGFKEDDNKLWRSQDLTTATDQHHPSETRALYYLINPGIEWWDDAVNVVCNFYTIIPSTELGKYRRFVRWRNAPLDPQFAKLPWVKKMIDEFDGLPKRKEVEVRFVGKRSGKILKYRPLDEFLAGEPERYVYPGTVSTIGQPMGVSSSWPLLPLKTLFAFETSSRSPIIEIERTVYDPPKKGIDVGNMIFGKSKGKIRKRKVPKNWRKIQTTGDDAIARMSKSHSDAHTEILNNLGASVSASKDFLHPRYALYTEIIADNGEVGKFFPWSPILAPHGVRRSTWYNQPMMVKALEVRHKRVLPLNASPYMMLYHSLGMIGIPLSADPLLGGLGNQALPIGDPSRLAAAARRLARTMDIGQPSFENIPNPLKDGLVPTIVDPSSKQALDLIRGPKTGEIVDRSKSKIAYSSPYSMLMSKESIALVPSKTFKIPAKTWEGIQRAKDVWENLSIVPQKEEHISVSEIINRFRDVAQPMNGKDIEDVVKSATAERQQEVEIPWSLTRVIHPSMGLYLRPFTGPTYSIRVSKESILLGEI